MWPMRRAGIVVLAVLAGCGGSGLEGTLRWQKPPSVASHSLSGRIQNATSHSVSLDPKAMRLLDDHGRKVGGRVHVGSPELRSGASTRLVARWRSGKPVRIDYGAGTLALPSS
jgi:hypothetical protein